MNKLPIITTDNKGRYHSYDGKPAVIYSHYHKEWYKHGVLHRDNDLPAVDSSTHKEYFYNGIRHRSRGPSIVWCDGYKEWWYDGRRYHFNEWIEKLKVPEEEKTEIILREG